MLFIIDRIVALGSLDLSTMGLHSHLNPPVIWFEPSW